jgi:hypothetical protein
VGGKGTGEWGGWDGWEWSRPGVGQRRLSSGERGVTVTEKQLELADLRRGGRGLCGISAADFMWRPVKVSRSLFYYLRACMVRRDNPLFGWRSWGTASRRIRSKETVWVIQVDQRKRYCRVERFCSLFFSDGPVLQNARADRRNFEQNPAPLTLAESISLMRPESSSSRCSSIPTCFLYPRFSSRRESTSFEPLSLDWMKRERASHKHNNYLAI